MRPQDIDKIASVVVGSLAGVRDAGLLGCGAISNPVQYDWPSCPTPANFDCGASYECGGVALFTCCENFTCSSGFVCPNPAGFWCQNDVMFTCAPGFECGSAFEMTAQCCHSFGG